MAPGEAPLASAAAAAASASAGTAAAASKKPRMWPRPPGQSGQCSHLKAFLAVGGANVFTPLARCCLAATFPGRT